MTRTLRLADAARELGCSVDTLRRYIKGQKPSGTKKPAFDPILMEGKHWFRRNHSTNVNAPYVLYIDKAKQELADRGLLSAEVG